MKVLRNIFFALAIVAVAHATYLYQHLPETVFSQVDGDGNPSTWTTRGGLIRGYVHGLIWPVLFFGVLPIILKGSEAARFLARQLYALGIATVVFMVSIFQVIYRANLHGGQVSMTPAFAVMGVFLAFSLGWTLHLILKLPRRDALSTLSPT